MGYGWMPTFTQRNWLALTLGANVNYEVPTTGEQETNLELVAGLSYNYFRYSDPERRLAVKLYIFPSVTDTGRVRASFDASYNLELWSDLFWKLISTPRMTTNRSQSRPRHWIAASPRPLLTSSE